MARRRGYGANESADAARQTWAKADENLLRVMRAESDCTAWEYPFYAVAGDGRYVLGFEDGDEADGYCRENRFVRITRDQACFRDRKPNRFSNWTERYTTKGMFK